MNVYVACPSGAVTGGIELLHQLTCELNKHQDVNAYIWYFSPADVPIPEAYKKYKNPYIEIEKPQNGILIFPEVYVSYANLPKYKDYKKVIYWESVDNYFRWIPEDQLYKFPDNVIHMYQSVYALNFLIKKVKATNVLKLTDYLNDDYLSLNNTTNERNDWVLYNPSKGMFFTKEIIDRLPDVEFKPIQGMTTQQIIELMQKSKLYIDFGDHPGKDRIPREAAMCGCCVITGRNGSANFWGDIPIDDAYKFDRNEEYLSAISSKILHVLNHYNEHKHDFDDYRKIIKREKEQFQEGVTELVNTIRPRFSIIIPAHNSANYIIKALSSVKSQTFKDYELIVVCDNCFDNTEQIAKQYGATTKRVMFGCDGPTRNKGIEMATGEYVLFMDDDDWWLHEYVLDQLDKKLKELGDADILCFSFIFKGLRYAEPSGNGGNHWNACWCKCYRRDKIGSSRFSNVKAWSDVDFYNSIMNKGLKIYDWDMPMYYYNYMRKGSQSEQYTNG